MTNNPAVSGLAERCDGCAQITYDRRNVSLSVNGNLRADRDLCAACRTNAIDGFLAARDGMVMRRVDWIPAKRSTSTE